MCGGTGKEKEETEQKGPNIGSSGGGEYTGPTSEGTLGRDMTERTAQKIA
jgi:hypothetical protein